MSIGANLKRLRIEKGITQEELAKAVHVAQPMIAQIERGTRAMTMELGKEVLEVLGVSVEEIWGESG